ncbi:hypothetical protein PGTUg99_006128 [Puccinia graminis f. sp. tritici]|uniref:Uncharacterized protein n=1 Tax=Puccinia graminis f. sp. tritici TaxID=56615 RepID=A0A5B0SGA4_PUCGR|nr:hypothetical protein PGTUg99_006128 [Puccinia graminis f. sp. tritici]
MSLETFSTLLNGSTLGIGSLGLTALTLPVDFTLVVVTSDLGLSDFVEFTESQSHSDGTTSGLLYCFFGFLAVDFTVLLGSERVPSDADTASE